MSGLFSRLWPNLPFQRKRRLSFGADEEDWEDQHHPKKYKREYIVIDDDDEPPTFLGNGSQSDPIIFTHWGTGNVIADGENGATFTISDDEDEQGFEGSASRGRSASRLERDHSRSQSESPLFVRPISPSPAPSGSIKGHSEGSSSPSTAQNSPNTSYGLLDDDSESEEPDTKEDSHYQRFLQGLKYITDDSSEEEDVDHEHQPDGNDSDDDVFFLNHRAKDPFDQGNEWTFTIKEEEEDDDEQLPLLSFSQDSEATIPPSAPGGAQYLGAPIPNLHKRKFDSSDRTLSPGPLAKRTPLDFSEKKLLLKAKKRLFWDVCWEKNRDKLKSILEDLYQDTNKGTHDTCWLYNGRRIYKTNRTIRIQVCFVHKGVAENIYINGALIAMLLAGLITQDHKEGIIEHSWHASHLCGNWTCLNPYHINPEPGSVNSNRNGCFADFYGPCEHSPQCLKHLKVDVSTLRPIAHG